MAKGTGLIGNFKGKVGNMVGYNLKDSNNKQTQGIRVYQPVVRNPKTYAQAEQRCIMKPVNDFYRALKPIISRGYEGKAYGNASRLVWLKNVMKDFQGPWLVKGSSLVYPIFTEVTKGSLPSIGATASAETGISLVDGQKGESNPATIGELFNAFKLGYNSLQSGDQLTIVTGRYLAGKLDVAISSFELVDGSNTAVSNFIVSEGTLYFDGDYATVANGFTCAIISREGANGAHLRSTEVVAPIGNMDNDPVYDEAESKDAAVRSYMSTGGNVDWPEETLTD